MAARDVSCPNCQKPIRVPAEAVGKRIKCKSCQVVFVVPDGDGPVTAKPATAKPAKPSAAKPAAAKPAKPKPVVVDDDPPPANPALEFSEDDENAPKEYGVTKDDLDVPRCPFCAKELEDESARICLNCGYDMDERRRHASRKTYNRTTGDYIMWWLPAVIWFGVLSALIGILIWMCINLGDMIQKDKETFGFMLQEEENKLTGRKDYFIHPMACDVCCGVIILGLAAFGGPVIWRRLKSPSPPEEEKKK
jgi:hypothetical protein